MPETKPKTVNEYIESAPKEAQKKLREIRAVIRKATPGATEDMKWRMPSYSYKRILVMFAGYKHHVGFYPTASPIKVFEKDILKLKLKSARGSVQFPLDEPLPLPLIKKMIALRIKESKEEDKKWRS